MTSANPIRFTLVDGTAVIVNEVTNNKYNFELRLLNGNRKTFVWSFDMPLLLTNSKGNTDNLATEAITKFKTIIINKQ